MRVRIPGFLIIVMLMLIPLALGQDGASLIEPYDDMMVNPDANISFPPPVYMVRDSVDIRGTVNLPSLLSYFVEFRPLVIDMMDTEEQEDVQWFPATIPQRSAVIDDIIGTWNTLTARDGLYELRLNINTGDGPQYVRLSPIRVENNPAPFLEQTMPEEVEEAPDPAAEPEPAEETVEEPLDDSPRVVAQVNSNVRAGDNTFYQIVGFLLEGETANVLGTSSRGTRWYFIELANGVSGFIHPNIVRTEGDLSNLKSISPPPLPPTPIPIPTAIPVEAAPAAPATGADLVFGGASVNPHPPTCNETYTVNVTIRNDGNADSQGVIVEVRDSRANDGQVLQTTRIGFPPVPVGQSRSAFGQITTSRYYKELHHINLYLDVDNQVAETNEGNNHHAEAPYVLRRGNCP